MTPSWQISGPVSDNAIYPDLMHRTNSGPSVFGLHWLKRPNYAKPWLDDRSAGRPEPPRTKHDPRQNGESPTVIPHNEGGSREHQGSPYK
jgi:hypothetical protein